MAVVLSASLWKCSPVVVPSPSRSGPGRYHARPMLDASPRRSRSFNLWPNQHMRNRNITRDSPSSNGSKPVSSIPSETEKAGDFAPELYKELVDPKVLVLALHKPDPLWRVRV
eukprot:1176741-Prorocentrum_minimum.AAC.2